MYMDYFHTSPGEEAEGDFGQFGAPQVKIKVQYDTEFVTLLTREAEERKVPAGTFIIQTTKLCGSAFPDWSFPAIISWDSVFRSERNSS